MDKPTGFRFIDVPTAAEALGVTRTQLLEWVATGRIKPFQGTGQAAVFRARDVEALAATLRAERQATADAAAAEAAAAPRPGGHAAQTGGRRCAATR